MFTQKGRSILLIDKLDKGPDIAGQSQKSRNGLRVSQSTRGVDLGMPEEEGANSEFATLGQRQNL